MGLDIIIVVTYLFLPYNIVPQIYYWLLKMIPRLPSTAEYMLMNLGDISISTIGNIGLASGIAYLFLLGYIVNFLKDTSIEWVFIVAGGLNAVLFMFKFLVIWAQDLGLFGVLFVQFGINILTSISLDLPLISLIGRFSENSPEGLESTAVNCLVALVNISSTINH